MATAFASRPQQRTPSRSAPSIASGRTQQPVSLTRRLLFPHLPADSEIPPLLASACPPELNAELYGLIALALRAYINPWWAKITRYDKEFLPEITRTLTVVVRELEARLLVTNLCPLLFCDIPVLVTQHYLDYRHAASKASTSYATGGAASLPQIFHQMQPHLAISADGRLDEIYFRQIVDYILQECLPPDDYASEAERLIIRETIMKMLLKDVIARITQPWFIQKTILDLLGPSEDDMRSKPSSPASWQLPSFSFHAILIFIFSTVQWISGACLSLVQAYKHIRSVVKRVNRLPLPRRRTQSPRILTSPPASPLPISSSTSHSVPSPPALSTSSSSYTSSTTAADRHPTLTAPDAQPLIDETYHYYAHEPLILFSVVFNFSGRFTSAAIMQNVKMLSMLLTPFLDRLLPYLLYNCALSTQSLVTLLRMSKSVLFPNGYPGVPPPDPTAEEQIVIREQLLRRSAARIPPFISTLLLGHAPRTALDAALDPLSDPACNAHLVLFILDAIVLALFPEMGVDANISGVGAMASESPQELSDGHGDSPSAHPTSVSIGRSVSFAPSESMPR